MIACFVLWATDRRHNNLVVAEVADAVAVGPLEIADQDVQMLAFIQLGPGACPDEVLTLAGYGRVEPWIDLPADHTRAARVDKMGVN